MPRSCCPNLPLPASLTDLVAFTLSVRLRVSKILQDAKRDALETRFIQISRTAENSFRTHLAQSDFGLPVEGLACYQHACLTRLTHRYKLEIGAILLASLVRIVSYAERSSDLLVRVHHGLVQLFSQLHIFTTSKRRNTVYFRWLLHS